MRVAGRWASANPPIPLAQVHERTAGPEPVLVPHSYREVMQDHDEIIRLYGPWRGRTPSDAATLLEGYQGLWWVAGGWAIEAFTGRPRPHGDLDPSIPRQDVALLRDHVAGRLDVWAADRGALRPLVEPLDGPLPATCGNLWLRRSGADPWEYDVILMDVSNSIWTYKRDVRIRRPIDDILWAHDGIRYLRPEVQLLHKAPGRRPNDEEDFEACVPLLNEAARVWLAEALRTAHPGHPWIDRLGPLVR